MSVFIVSVQNLRDRSALENQPMWHMKYLLEKQGILTEFVTPFNDLIEKRPIKGFVWRLLYRISRIKGFSILYLLLLLLMVREIYHQIRISWRDFNSIFAYDALTAYVSAIASRKRIPVYLMTRNGYALWSDYTSIDALANGSLGCLILRKILNYLSHCDQSNIVTLSDKTPNDAMPPLNLAQAG
jgi:hypothetical protein